ncbi:zinc finger and BTB domain-containing protein 41-like isoform X2 [Aricia agestis]|uniref:zinc finger and BTB domain-containing protein 41-like isoform X2 n=1 Tax=Aricia agestis TaxID=91739 RepID=UPI001C2064C6|nr:zinc finger and BTB domain-containing protein 41-like isoform X2 [Aricia agestis]
MPACAIKHCNNKSSVNNKASGITYHRFPTDPFMYDQWLHIVRLLQEESYWKPPTKYTVICSIHFKESDLFIDNGGAKRLHKTAVPMRPMSELFLSSTLLKNNYITTELSTSVSPDKTAGNETSPPDNFSGIDCISVDSSSDIDMEQKVSTLDMEYNELTTDKTAGNETSPPDNFSGVDCISVDSTSDIDTEQKVSTLDMEYNELTTEDYNNYNISFNTEDSKIFRLDQWNSKVSAKVCRTCLAVDVKMFNIGHYKLKQYYQNLTGILFIQEDVLPKMMCWECVARLQNANSFREKALRSYDLLLKNIKSKTTVSITDVLSINRVGNGLTSALAVAHMSDVSCGTHSDDVTTIEVKEEVDMWSETEVVDSEDQEQTDQEDPLKNPEQQDQEDRLEDHKQQDQKNHEDHEKHDKEGQEDALDTRLARRLSSSFQTCDPERPAPAKKTTKRRARGAGRAAQRAELDSSIFKVVAVPMERALAEAAKRATRPQYRAAQYRCDVCYKTFTTPTAEEEHALRHSDVMGLFECAVCRGRWRTRNALVKHFTASHKMDHICKLCPFTSRHRTAARAHERFHKGVKFQCSLCPKEFVSNSAYLTHLRLKHVCRHPCALCGFTFLTRRGVEMHRLRNHKRHKDVELTGPYCAECDVRFANDDAHDRHLQLSAVHRREDVQNSSQPFYNNYCDAEERKYRGKNQMKSEHTRTKRAKPKQRALICCEQCGEKCEGYRGYVQHFRRQHPGCNRTQYSGPDPVMCEHCGRVFQHPCLLRVHAAELVAGKLCGAGRAGGRTDASRRLYSCPICPKRFTAKSNRSRHIVSIHHGAERRFQCSVCDKRFWERGGLQSHYDHVHLKKPWPQRTRPPRPCPSPATGQELESARKDANAEI